MGAEFLSRHFRDVIRLRNHILDSAQGELCDNEIAELTEMLASAKNSETFRECIRDISDNLTNELSSEDTNNLEYAWPFISREIKLAELQRIVDMQADIQSRVCGVHVPKTKVELKNKKSGVAATAFDYKAMGSHNDRILLNSNKEFLFTDFLSALEAVTHEQHHQLHNALARAAKHGKMQAHHPLYDDARYFKHMWDRKALVGFKPCYDVHLDERNSERFGRLIRKNVGRYLDKAEGYLSSEPKCAI